MAWVYLSLASVVEIVMAISLKYAAGWTRLVPSAIGVLAAACSVLFLTLAMRSLPAGTAYAIWTGTGSVGVAVLGIWLFNDALTPLRILCIALIIAGTIGLRLLDA
ncbi:MAG: Quaternary ammonium compound-resistance protein SugE [Herbaspirillum frisingense]|uniref:Guanidinium exporter n=1 Tax=Herbaspirillum frisingense TaxID=92645 RepID=A0A7V8FY29_9BURK|nr:MAG: Quaternary ammonium compound-resistance protein SugE [Herbaspirillum frisingense]